MLDEVVVVLEVVLVLDEVVVLLVLEVVLELEELVVLLVLDVVLLVVELELEVVVVFSLSMRCCSRYVEPGSTLSGRL